MSFLPPVLCDLVNVDTVKAATAYVQNLPPEDKSVVTTWLVFEGIGRIVYYVLLFLAVFLLGRRMIQGVIAGYREARAQSV